MINQLSKKVSQFQYLPVAVLGVFVFSFLIFSFYSFNIRPLYLAFLPHPNEKLSFYINIFIASLYFISVLLIAKLLSSVAKNSLNPKIASYLLYRFFFFITVLILLSSFNFRIFGSDIKLGNDISFEILLVPYIMYLTYVLLKNESFSSPNDLFFWVFAAILLFIEIVPRLISPALIYPLYGPLQILLLIVARLILYGNIFISDIKSNVKFYLSWFAILLIVMSIWLISGISVFSILFYGNRLKILGAFSFSEIIITCVLLFISLWVTSTNLFRKDKVLERLTVIMYTNFALASFYLLANSYVNLLGWQVPSLMLRYFFITVFLIGFFIGLRNVNTRFNFKQAIVNIIFIANIGILTSTSYGLLDTVSFEDSPLYIATFPNKAISFVVGVLMVAVFLSFLFKSVHKSYEEENLPVARMEPSFADSKYFLLFLGIIWACTLIIVFSAGIKSYLDYRAEEFALSKVTKPYNWPKDVPIYKGKMVVSNEENQVVQVKVITEDHYKLIESFYKNNLKVRGWKFEKEASEPGIDFIFKKRSRWVSLTVGRDEGKNLVVVRTGDCSDVTATESWCF